MGFNQNGSIILSLCSGFSAYLPEYGMATMLELSNVMQDLSWKVFLALKVGYAIGNIVLTIKLFSLREKFRNCSKYADESNSLMSYHKSIQCELFFNCDIYSIVALMEPLFYNSIYVTLYATGKGSELQLPNIQPHPGHSFLLILLKYVR